jgi:predicted esterase
MHGGAGRKTVERPIAIGPEPAEAAAVAILVHGRGRSPQEMRDIALALGLPAIRFVMPAAPGGSWYPESFLAPIDRNEPALSRSIASYGLAIDEIIGLGVPAEQIVLCGFSQGACLTAETAIRHPRRYGGIAILTGGLIGPPGTAWPVRQELAGVPVYLSGSHIDEWVPVSRVEETAAVFTRCGAEVTQRIFDDRAHLVSEEEVAAFREMLLRLAAEKRRDRAASPPRRGMLH